MKEIKWRKVEEGLPEEVLHEGDIKGEGASDDVLVRTASGTIISAWYDYKRHAWITFGVGKERNGYEEILTWYDNSHDDTVVEWCPIPWEEQGQWIKTEVDKPLPGAYHFIEVSFLDEEGKEESRTYDVYFHDGESWCSCENGNERTFDYWRPLQEIRKH